MTTILQKVRCPKCGKTEGCGWDAYAEFDPVTQSTVLGGEYDNGWCNDCGDIEPVFYEPVGEELAELQRQIRAREAAERLKAAAPDLLAALTMCLEVLQNTPASKLRPGTADALRASRAAISNATGELA